MSGITMYHLEFGVSEASFRDLVDRGGKLLTVCIEDTSPVRGNFQGGWEFYAFNTETSKWVQLVKTRGPRRSRDARVIRTVNGLCAFQKDLGFPIGIIPFGVGSGVETGKAGGVHFIDRVSLG